MTVPFKMTLPLSEMHHFFSSQATVHVLTLSQDLHERVLFFTIVNVMVSGLKISAMNLVTCNL